MRIERIIFGAIYGALLGALVWQPNYPVAIGLFITAALFLLTDEEPKSNDAWAEAVKNLSLAQGEIWEAIHRHTSDLGDVKSNVSKLNLGAGLKNLKKD